ncbi:transporter substrate-binding domain-containing protein [Magnetovibrio sp.]|uniref:transporter substrate-binding domain-containing protein n=1 Tax=Magnetovibrio sp. TaxID=2024836 RepID=UPI002F955FDF
MMTHNGICRAGFKRPLARGYSGVLALSFLLLVFLSPGRAWAESEITAAVTSNFPPYYTLNDKGQPEGFAIDIMNAIAKRSGFRVRYIIKNSWPEATKALQDGEVDVIPNAGITEQREAFAKFTPPVETFPVSIFVRTETQNIFGLRDLDGKTVAVVTNNVGYSLLKQRNNINLKVFDDKVNALFALTAGEVDALVYPEPVAMQIARKAKIDHRIHVVGMPLTEITRAIAVRKDAPELHATLSQAVAWFVRSPEYRAIYVKWFGTPTPYWTKQRIVWTILFVSAAFLLVIVIAAYFARLNRNLRLEVINRTQAEQRLQQTKQDLISAQEIARLGSWRLDIASGELWWSDEIYRIFGIPYDEFGASYEAFLDAIHPDDKAYVAQQYEGSMQGTFPYDIEHRIIRHDTAEVRWVHEKCEHIRNAQGEVIRSKGTVQDITERKLVSDRLTQELEARKIAEEKLQETLDQLEVRVEERTRDLSNEVIARQKSEAELRKLSRAVEQSSSVIYITDIDATIEYVNPKFSELLGYTPDEAIGRNAKLLQSGNTPTEVYQDMWQAILSGDEWRGELEDRTKSGEVFWAAVSISPVRDEHNAITHFIAMHENITARKNTEIAMANARQAAELANKAKTDLMANMSHELRTPLNAIIGFSETMKHSVFGPLGNAQYEEYAGFIHSSGTHLLQLINDILDVSAVEAGKLNLREEEVIVQDICAAAMQIISPKADEKCISLKPIDTPDLPMLMADPLRLKQIFINLLSNAVKFTPENGNISCDAHIDEQNKMVLTITDTGIGMDHDGLDKAMTKFGQVDSSLSRTHEGTGLGLPLTQGLVELHGGTMELESAIGKGTKVSLTFPAERVLTLEL